MGRPRIPSATGGDGSPMTVRWRDNVLGCEERIRSVRDIAAWRWDVHPWRAYPHHCDHATRHARVSGHG
jgi:hypothetical protein